ncbi:catechol 2,3-dioxygenase-like lactoylglutathione lyase family enzyme [Actinoplanes octamycinicus]|uniref:Catechol 2,3-dioxygenase-like lactoylglutathione lyase family enzyme n=1 Tax=Actinoplanes octamycinicus TaxID=135948 RepID=A0A7W7H7B4_9ACTN|nr:VOC family protein [Actinoplanes octamycinicus]MBB4745269.1 catechol 2,3-dioxygenase-like lactoylglutathione lyase family enzyme [Actinoplanes octamycinicus]GIE62253.1 glyoxalase [Actinoplanes octamycinicus]
MKLVATTISSPDPRRLADFYARLLGLPITEQSEGWVELPGLSFHAEPDYAPPAWPARPGHPQMQMHLDIQVDDLPAAVTRAVELGATVAEFQPQDDVRVCLDPDGHPFCLYVETDG